MLDLLLSDALLITYPLLPVSTLVFWDSRVDRMSTTSDVGEIKLTFLDLLSLPSLEICPFDLCRSSLCCQLGSDSRSAQGPGHHQGAAAVLVSPNLATTFSSHTWAKEKRKSRVWWERRSRRLVSWKERRHKKQENKKKEENDLINAATEEGASTLLLPPRQKLPAPTTTRQLRANFYSSSCTGISEKQCSSEVTTHYLPPFSYFSLTVTLNLYLTPRFYIWSHVSHLTKVRQPTFAHTGRFTSHCSYITHL